MDSSSLPDNSTFGPAEIEVEKPALKSGAINFISNIVIGVASVGPGYSLATTLGFIAAIPLLGLQSPATIWVAFLPMAAVAAAYYWLNRAEPDCGTTFAWMTRAMGPYWGWQGGWAIVVADVLVMPNLAQVSAQYTFSLFGSTPSNFWITVVGIIWIAVMTVICYIGIELNAITQRFLLAMEFITLLAFAAVALIKVYSGTAMKGAVHPQLSWYNPFDIHGGINAFIGGILLAIFLYWGWDSGVAINEETEDSGSAPGRAAIISTIVLVLLYLIVTTAAQAYGGLGFLVAHQQEVFTPLSHSVFGSPLDKIVALAILSSASASTQTTILPTARTAFSMGRAGAAPKQFGEIHPRHLSPSFATIWMGVVSTLVFVLLMATSTKLISDAFTALAITIAFYYGFTGYACVIYYRKHLFDSFKHFVGLFLIPAAGALFLTYIIIKAFIVYSKPHAGYAKPFLGIGSPVAIALLTIVLGLIGMLIQRVMMPRFFMRRAEIANPAVFEADYVPPTPEDLR